MTGNATECGQRGMAAPCRSFRGWRRL